MDKLPEFERKIWEYFKRYDDAYETFARRGDLSFTSLSVLDCLCMLGEGCTQKEIAAELHFSKQQVNQTVSFFLADGYVRLNENPADRRNKKIFLTEAGKVFAERSMGPLRGAGTAAAGTLSEEEQALFLSLLGRYVKRYEEEAEKGAAAGGE